MSQIKCCYCDKILEKDIFGLNKKILGRNIKKFMCISCLADYIDSSEEDLYIKIAQFKEQGCILFK